MEENKFQKNIGIQRTDSVISSKDSYSEIDFDIMYHATSATFTNAQILGLVKLGPIAFFGENRLTTSRRNVLKLSPLFPIFVNRIK